MTDTSAELRLSTSPMTIGQAVALAWCPAESRCWPRCQHCTAAPEEIEAARAWLEEHPVAVEVWRLRKLGEIDTALRIWEALPDATRESRWAVESTNGCEAEQIIGDLSRGQAEALANAHNVERDATLALFDSYTGV